MRGTFGLGCSGLGRGAFGVALLLAVACGGHVEDDTDDTNDGGVSTGGRAVSQGGAPNVKGGAPSTGGTPSTNGGSTTGGVSSDVDPGSAVAGASATGTGQCEGHSLGEVLMNIHAKHPELSDINTFFDPNAGLIGDGSFVHAFPHDDGFRLVLTRGSGDCESGCIDKEYWYFETRTNCFPFQVGRYSRKYISGSNCMELTGTPMWGFPGAPPPGDDGSGCNTTPKDVRGLHKLLSAGTRLACSHAGSAAPVGLLVTLEIEQESTDLSQASVIIDGTDNDLLDGQRFAASMTGSLLRVEETVVHPGDDESPSCGASLHLTLSYDFARESGSLTSEEVRYLDCSTMDYCKGALLLSLMPEARGGP